MRNFIKKIKRAAYRRRVRHLRANIAVGDRIQVIRGQELFPGVVLNVRLYAHGSTEVWAQCDDFKYAGWVALESVLPVEGVR